MMGLGEIVRLSAEATNRARRTRRQPATVNPAIAAILARGELSQSGISFPFLGDYTPKGWRQYGDAIFADMTGLDSYGPAISFGNLARRIATGFEQSPRHGWATIEQGQFQCYVQEYAPKTCTCPRCLDAQLSS